MKAEERKHLKENEFQEWLGRAWKSITSGSTTNTIVWSVILVGLLLAIGWRYYSRTTSAGLSAVWSNLETANTIEGARCDYQGQQELNSRPRCAISQDPLRDVRQPGRARKSYAKWLYQEWGKLMPELYDRGYWSNLADPGFPFIIVHRLRDEIPACHALGVKGWRVETFPNYGPLLPSNYVAAKLMWDHKADVDALLQDFDEKFFGPAAGPMGKYVTLMDAALRDSPYCTGSAWDMPHHYPPAVRKQARALLDEGAKLAAGQGVYEQRVRMIADTFEMLEAFIAMLDAAGEGRLRRGAEGAGPARRGGGPADGDEAGADAVGRAGSAPTSTT